MEYPEKSCLRCCEYTCEKSGPYYKCHACGFIERERPRASESVEAFQDRIERTLDLVEIFNFGKRRKVKGR